MILFKMAWGTAWQFFCSHEVVGNMSFMLLLNIIDISPLNKVRVSKSKFVIFKVK
jgi:hypothetical protein